MYRKALAFVVTALAVAAPVTAERPQTAPASRPAIDPAEAERRAVALKQVSEQLICQCSCNMILAECSHQNCPFAIPERKHILERLEAGDAPADIVQSYVDDYGRSCLSAPPVDGDWIDRLAWWGPAAALVVGLGIVVHLIRTYTQAPPVAATGSGTAAPEPTAPEPTAERSDDLRARIERELGDGGAGP